MVQDLRFLDYDTANPPVFRPYSYNPSYGYTYQMSLPVGANFANGDLRVVLTRMTTATTWRADQIANGGSTAGTSTGWGTPSAGWNRYSLQSQTQVTGAGFYGTGLYDALWWKVLSDGDTDGSAPMTGVDFQQTILHYFAVTIRHADPGQSLTCSYVKNETVGATTGVDPGDVSLSLPSKSVLDGGAYLTWWVSPYGPMFNPSTGLVDMWHTAGNGADYDSTDALTYPAGSFLAGQEYSTAGTTGTKSATIKSTPQPRPVAPTYSTSSSQFRQYGYGYGFTVARAPDITVAVGVATETDTAATVTPVVSTTTTTVAVGCAVETDTAQPVNNPLFAQRTSDLISLDPGPILNSRISWEEGTENTHLYPSPTLFPGANVWPDGNPQARAAGSTVTVETSVNGGRTWDLCTNGAPIPRLIRGTKTISTLLHRVTLARLHASDPSPSCLWIDPRVSIDTSYVEMSPLGVFVVTSSTVTESGGAGSGSGGGSGGSGSVVGFAGGQTGGGRSVDLTGVDLSYVISRRTFDDVYVIKAGTNRMDAVAEIARKVMPDVVLNLGKTPLAIDTQLIFDAGQDPWTEAIQGICLAIGWEAYFDGWGRLCARPIPDPAVDVPVWTLSDGSDGRPRTIVGYSYTVDDSTSFSHVVATGVSSGNEDPVRGEWFDTDPTSRTNIYGSFGVVTTTFESAAIQTQADADQAASAIGRYARGSAQTLQVDHLPVPFLVPSDVIAVVRPSAGLNGSYWLNGFTIPLGVAAAQTSELYRQTQQ